VLGMGVRGAAIATVISQGAAFFYGLAFFVRGRSAIPFGVRYLRIHPRELSSTVAIGMPAFIRQVSQSVIIILVNNVLAGYGDVSIAAFGIVYRVMIFSLLPILGIGQGFQPIVGFNYGAGHQDRVVEAVRVTRLVALAVSSVPFLLVLLFAPSIASAFTTDQSLVAIAASAMRVTLIAVPLVALQVVGAIYFQAIGRALPALFLSLSRQVIFLIPALLILPRVFGRTGVWMAFPVADLLATAVTVGWLHVALRDLRPHPVPTDGAT
jgi:Na+-driven multidrug efflux pump